MRSEMTSKCVWLLKVEGGTFSATLFAHQLSCRRLPDLKLDGYRMVLDYRRMIQEILTIVSSEISKLFSNSGAAIV